MTSSPKVSVVVPVYNPGRYLTDCVTSLLHQDLPTDEYEVIFTDDGSTDDSPARLDSLAAAHPHVRVIHQENSGWSGKPRNVGIDAARGEYVFFVDDDDWLSHHALRRLYDFATAHDADVVVPKMAGIGRGVPRELFRHSHPQATLATAPLIDSLTPHKLFKKAFLDRHRLRFPEGRRRLEDHVFVTKAYFLADRISVASDDVYYHHVRRDDAGNAASRELDPKGYFANLCEALDIVDAHTEPGRLRDRLHRRWLRVEMVERMRGARLLRLPEGYRQELFDTIREVVRTRFAPGVAAGLPAMQRLVATLIAADRLDDLTELAEWESRIRAVASRPDIQTRRDVLELTVRTELRHGREPVTFGSADGRDRLDPPLSSAAASHIGAAQLDVTQHLAGAKVDVLLRAPDTSAEYFAPSTSRPERVPISEQGRDRFRLVWHITARLDPKSLSAARDGWDVVVRVSCCGWTKDVTLAAVPTTATSRRRRLLRRLRRLRRLAHRARRQLTRRTPVGLIRR